MTARRVVAAGAALLLVLVTAGLAYAWLGPRPPGPAVVLPTTAAPSEAVGTSPAPPGPPAVTAPDGVSWAMVDLGSAEGIGSPDSTRHRAGAMLADLGRPAEVLATCPKVDEVAPETTWSASDLSAMAAARLGACLATGGAEIPDAWRTTETWDIPDAVAPARPAAVTSAAVQEADDSWHTGCLVIGQTWTVAVLATYSDQLGPEYGPAACRSVLGDLSAYLAASRAPLAGVAE